MDDTHEIRKEMLDLWKQFKAGKLSATEARTHIGFARTVMETLKVEIAAAHLNVAHVPAVSLQTKTIRSIGGRKAA